MTPIAESHRARNTHPEERALSKITLEDSGQALARHGTHSKSVGFV